MTVLDLKKAKWYINRLRVMSLAEVCHRLRERLLIEQERFLKRRSSSPRPRFVGEMGDALTRFRQESDVHFFFSWSDREKTSLYQSSFSKERDANLREADVLLNHTITLFGRQFNLGNTINWSRDPVTEREWPGSFWADVDTRDGQTVGGVKWVWELNRHHYLVTLGKAYFVSGEDQYAEQVCAQLLDWINNNPLYSGVNWTSSLELAIRLINWTWALAFIRRARILTPQSFATIMQSVMEQADHISRHLSAHSSANNHLIGEAAGLAVVGLSFPWLPRANRWRDVGLSLLVRELKRQIHSDGVPAEQAMHYLAFVLDFNLLAWRLAELNGLDVPQIWYERLGAACDFIRHVMDEQGNVPAIGDSDDAWVVRLDDRLQANNYRSILATAAALLERPDLKTSVGRWDEKSHWLLGASGLATFNALPVEESQITSRVFQKGGYCVMRVPGRLITFDCGSLGYLSIAAHGHADALNLTLSLEGQPLLIDPGTYAYHEGSKQRDYFKSTVAHNTVVIDGQDQSESLGTFLWGRKANAQLLHWNSTPEYDLAIAEHDGYKKVDVIHRRTVLFYRPDWILVVDRLQGHGQHSFEQLWHLATDCQVNVESEHIQLTLGHKQCVIIPLEMPTAQVQVRQGEKQPMQGWASSHYGQIAPAPVVSLSGQFQPSARLATALYLKPAPSAAHLLGLAVQMLDLLNDLEKVKI